MKKWDKPALIILVRGKPEERILGLCKGFQLPGGAVEAFEGCIQNHVNCEDCDGLSES